MTGPRLPRKWRIEDLPSAVKQSRSMSELLRALGLRCAGGNHKTVKSKIDELKLDISHFDPYSVMADACRARKEKIINEETVFVLDGIYSKNVVKRLARKHIPSARCSICNSKPIWNNQPLVFQLDHINGNTNDNRKENLRWVCPNCHTQTPNFAGRSSYHS